MTRYYFSFLLLITLHSTAQDTPSPSKKKLLKPGLVVNDSFITRMQHLKDSMMNQARIYDSTAISENLNRGLDDLLKLQKKNREKQKRAAFIRIGIGVLFLLVLIIGLRRMKKSKRSGL
jgi:hypothetical protein